MAYIITSKTKRRRPNGRTMTMEHKETGEVRVLDERQAEKKTSFKGWSEPVASPIQPRDKK